MKSVTLEEHLDLVDAQSVLQESLHEYLATGFLALAREKYRDPSAATRLAALAQRDGACAETYLNENGHVHMETGTALSPLAPLPSKELKDAVVAFRQAVITAAELARARTAVRQSRVRECEQGMQNCEHK